MKWPEGHIVGKPVSKSTYQRLGCRCEGCRELNAQYIREYRERTPKQRSKDRQYMRARHRALQRLLEKHRKEFERILAEEREAS